MKLPSFKGKGMKPAVDIDNSVALLELMESDHDSARRAACLGEVPAFRVHPSPCGFRPDINPMKLNQLLDQLETNDAEKINRSR